MNFSILLMTLYHITLLSENQVSVSSYLTSFAFILGASIVVTFLVGILITGFAIEMDMVWFLFNGFNYTDYCGEPARYIRANFFRLIFYCGAVAVLYYIAPKVI